MWHWIVWGIGLIVAVAVLLVLGIALLNRFARPRDLSREQVAD